MSNKKRKATIKALRQRLDYLEAKTNRHENMLWSENPYIYNPKKAQIGFVTPRSLERARANYEEKQHEG